jgi:hypothetical protein
MISDRSNSVKGRADRGDVTDSGDEVVTELHRTRADRAHGAEPQVTQ